MHQPFAAIAFSSRLRQDLVGRTEQIPASRWDEISTMALEQAEWIRGDVGWKIWEDVLADKNQEN